MCNVRKEIEYGCIGIHREFMYVIHEPVSITNIANASRGVRAAFGPKLGDDLVFAAPPHCMDRTNLACAPLPHDLTHAYPFFLSLRA